MPLALDMDIAEYITLFCRINYIKTVFDIFP
jgi:hypothetical protein